MTKIIRIKSQNSDTVIIIQTFKTLKYMQYIFMCLYISNNLQYCPVYLMFPR